MQQSPDRYRLTGKKPRVATQPFLRPTPFCAAQKRCARPVKRIGRAGAVYLQERLSEPEARAMLAYAEENAYPAVQLAVAQRLGLQIKGYS